MPLSKKRDRERKRQSRLENRIVRPSQLDPEVRALLGKGRHITGDRIATEAIEFLGQLLIDADGNPVYDS